MAEVEPVTGLLPNGAAWVYALFAMFFVFSLFVMFAPYLLEIDQHVKNLLLRCRHSLSNAEHKDKDEIRMDHLARPGLLGCRHSGQNVVYEDKEDNEIKIDQLERPDCLLPSSGEEAPEGERTGMRKEHSLLVKSAGERTQKVCPVTTV